MGLDFSLYRKRKDMTAGELFDLAESMPYSDFEKDYELAYGRKAWELVYALATKEDIDNGGGILQKEAWDQLILTMKPIGKKLRKTIGAYYHEAYADKVPYPELLLTEEDKKLINEYEMWYQSSFNDVPMLGYEFSLGYMLRFWNAQDEVNHYLEDPEYDVYMDISY